MCERDRSATSILLPIVLVFGALVVAACYIWTWQNGDLPEDVGGVAYISDTGNAWPQQALFGAGLTIVALYLSWLGFVRYWQLDRMIAHLHVTPDTDNIERKCCGSVNDLAASNTAALVFQEAACLCLILLSWFNDLDYEWPHRVFASICFVGLATYQVMHTIIASDLSSAFYSWAYHSNLSSKLRHGVRMEVEQGLYYQPTTRGMFAWYVLFTGFSAAAAGVGLVHYIRPSLEGVPSVAEWILALSSVLYVAPFFYETQNATLKTIGSQCARYAPLDMDRAPDPDTDPGPSDADL